MMNNLQSSAQVANKLLTVLQEYSKTIRLLLVMFVALSVSAEVWGTEVTINANQITGFGSGSNYTSSSITIGDITIASNSGFSTTQFRVAKSKNLTISCSVGKITKVVFDVSSTNYKLNADGISWSSTTGTYTNATGVESVTFTNSSANIARITKIVITYTTSGGGDPVDPYTVTLVPGSGSVTNTELEEPNAGEGVTLPTPTLDCGDWEFAGWKTTSAVTTETTTEPTLIPAGAYSPTSDITLYAVYQKTEGGGGSSTTTTFTFADIASAKNWNNGTAYTPVEISPITITANGGGNNAKYYISDETWRMYNGGSLEITTSTGSITNVSSNPSCTFTITNGMATCSFSETTKFKSITVTSGGTTTTTYYHSTPDCTTQTVICAYHNIR